MSSAIYHRPAEIAQNLIRFDTTNPPGNEILCINYLNGLLTDAGFETQVLAKEPSRANLVTRLKGEGHAPPLLLQGHVDVVSTANQPWTKPPFDGIIENGYLWGRGALDMKSGVSMMVAALMRAKAEGANLPGDVILAVVSDEEYEGIYGARYLVEEHAHLLEGVRYAIGEGGGAANYISGRKFYDIMVGEKQVCWMKATVRGVGGHASMPRRGGAMTKLAQMLAQLDSQQLPVHLTPVVRQLIEALMDALPAPASDLMCQLLEPEMTDKTLDKIGGDDGRWLNALLHNTVTPTVVKGGSQTNVIPTEITVQLDGRLLPGFTPDDMLAELRAIIGNEIEIEIEQFNPGPPPPDMTLYDMLADILRQADPTGVPIPTMATGVTDAAFFSRLGIQTYGFLPMNIPPDFDWWATIHNADERVPVAALDFGAQAVYSALQRFGESLV
jgi:acetylornithine deacetylase/succinyl-diaminopimelate desuccinylase-like protein